MTQPTNVNEWVAQHIEEFKPPICNKLMHKNQLSVMFVGGPNKREDFHIELGSELFFQLRGRMELPIIEQNTRRVVTIPEGHVFLLPSRVPHSPQRPEAQSLGLVIERERVKKSREDSHEKCDEMEMDAIRFYTNFATCERVLWDHYFPCEDLGRDLVPVVRQFWASEEARTRIPGSHIEMNPPFETNDSDKIPDPIHLGAYIDEHRAALSTGSCTLDLFGDMNHPDGEIKVLVVGGPHSSESAWELETLFYQLEGQCTVRSTTTNRDGREEYKNGEGDERTVEVREGCIFVTRGPFKVERSKGSIGLQITQDPRGNRPTK